MVSPMHAKRLALQADANGDGKLDVKEFKEMLKNDFATKGYDLQKGFWWAECGSLYLTKRQFAAFCENFRDTEIFQEAMPTLSAEAEWLLDTAFANFDADGDKTLSTDEIVDFIATLTSIGKLDSAMAANFMKAADANSDGMLSPWEWAFCLNIMSMMLSIDAARLRGSPSLQRISHKGSNEAILQHSQLAASIIYIYIYSAKGKKTCITPSRSGRSE